MGSKAPPLQISNSELPKPPKSNDRFRIRGFSMTEPVSFLHASLPASNAQTPIAESYHSKHVALPVWLSESRVFLARRPYITRPNAPSRKAALRADTDRAQIEYGIQGPRNGQKKKYLCAWRTFHVCAACGSLAVWNLRSDTVSAVSNRVLSAVGSAFIDMAK